MNDWKIFNREFNYVPACKEFFRLRRECKEHEWIWEQDRDPTMQDGKNYCAWFALGEERMRAEKALPQQEIINSIMGTAGDRVYMVTINYPDKFTDFKFMEEIMDHLKTREWVKKIKWTHEYYTDQGNHPHTHIILTLYKKLSPRRLAESVYALKGIKKYCEALNFVQVEKDFTRTWMDREDYINGVKKNAKLLNCTQDEAWRALHFTPLGKL